MHWEDRFALGLPLIDHQHRELFARVQAFRATVRAGDLQGASRLLDYLGVYVFEHFSTEEVEMMEGGYPGLEAHQRLHEAFVSTVERLGQRVRAQRFDARITAELDRVVETWLTQHLLVEDRAFGDWLRTRASDEAP